MRRGEEDEGKRSFCLKGGGTARVNERDGALAGGLERSCTVFFARVHDDATEGLISADDIEAVERCDGFEACGDGRWHLVATVVDEESGATDEWVEGDFLAEFWVGRFLAGLSSEKFVVAGEKSELIGDDGGFRDVDLGVSGSLDAFGTHVVTEFGAGLVSAGDEENRLI